MVILNKLHPQIIVFIHVEHISSFDHLWYAILICGSIQMLILLNKNCMGGDSVQPMLGAATCHL